MRHLTKDGYLEFNQTLMHYQHSNRKSDPERFSFGDTITSDYLPSRYRLEKGAHVVFTVTKYTHTIKGNDWQTDLSCISRIVKDD